MASTAWKKPKDASVEAESLENGPSTQIRSSGVDLLIQEHGANAVGIAYSDNRGKTMKALLHHYTQNATLAEVDENGEHVLIPTGRGRDRGEPRTLAPRAVGGENADNSRNVGEVGKMARIDALLRNLANDRLLQLKDRFAVKEDELSCDEFVSALMTQLGPLEGDTEIEAAALLADLHEELVRSTPNCDPRVAFAISPVDISAGSCARSPSASVQGRSSSVRQRDEVVVCCGESGKAVFLTEALVDSTEALVSWTRFASLLVERGIVGDVVNGFDVVKVLTHIDLDSIATLADEFKEHGNSLSLERFVAMMKRQFSHIFELIALFDLRAEGKELVAQLCNLFEMIDVSGKNTMAWEDFTGFLVEQGMTQDVAREFNIIRFSPSCARDDLVHQSHVQKAFYFKHYDKIAFIEQGFKSLKLCTPDLILHRELKDFAQTPLCAEYIDKYLYVVVACSDLSLSFYDVDNNLKLVKRFETKTAQLVMCWSELGQVLFSADHEGRIFAWDIGLVKASIGRASEPSQGDPWKDFLKRSIAQQDTPMRHMDLEDTHYVPYLETNSGLTGSATKSASGKSHRARGKVVDPRHANSGSCIVMMLLELPVLGQMASCGVDHNIMIWDVYTGHLKRTLRGHAMGVRCMAFATFAKVLVTGGFDHNLFVWNPYVGKSIHTIQGHTAPIVGIETLGPTTNQAISADADCSLKTWDLGTYQCLQTIVVDKLPTLRALVSIPSHQRVLACDRTFVAFDYQSTGVADQTDESPIIKVIYSKRTKVFLTGCSSHLRVWDATTGGICCVIQHKEAEVTDFCVDSRERTVFIADHDGNVYAHNLPTGCFIKKLTQHDKEVSGLVYCGGDKNLITVSWDRSLMVHDESEKMSKVWRKASNIHNGDVTCVAYSRHLGLIATGSTDCVISLREYERLRTVASLIGHKSDITALVFVEPFALLASADISGFVAIWAVPQPSGRPHRFVNEVLTRFLNIHSLENSAAVNCLHPFYGEWDGEDQRFILFAGDDDGDARAWDLTQLLKLAEIVPCDAKLDWDPRKKDKIDCTHTATTMARKAISPETPELSMRIPGQVMREVRSWKAHSDSVRSITLLHQPDCILTSGYDNMVKIWDLGGILMTVLKAYGAAAWKFPIPESSSTIDQDAFQDLLTKVEAIESERLKGSRRLHTREVEERLQLEATKT